MALRCHFFSTLSTLSSKIWWVTQWSDKEMFSQPPHLFDFAFLSLIERSLSIPMPSPAESLNGCLLTLWWYPKKPTKCTDFHYHSWSFSGPLVPLHRCILPWQLSSEPLSLTNGCPAGTSWFFAMIWEAPPQGTGNCRGNGDRFYL